MKLVVLALMILALSCRHTAPLVSNVSDLSPTAVEEKLGITERKDQTERYSGYYSYIILPGGEEILNGPFELMYENTESDPEVGEIITRIVYSGRYVNGSKEGRFVEDLFYDDSVDMYSKWKATLFYEPDSERCTGGNFNGWTYEREWSHEESSPDECTFDYLVKRSYEKLKESASNTIQPDTEPTKKTDLPTEK